MNFASESVVRIKGTAHSQPSDVFQPYSNTLLIQLMCLQPPHKAGVFGPALEVAQNKTFIALVANFWLTFDSLLHSVLCWQSVNERE